MKIMAQTFRELLFLSFVIITFSIFLLFFTWRQSFRLDTDYDSNFPVYGSVFSQTPLTGISVWGDPLSAIWNPLFSIPVLTLGTEYGFRVTIVFVIMLSALAMWWLLRSLHIPSKVQLWGSLIYASSGTLAARIAAGHIEKVLSYSLVPIFLLALLQKRGTLAGLVSALAFLSGDVYLVWFFVVFWFASLLWRWIVEQDTGIRLVIDLLKFALICAFVSTPKLIPFIRDVVPTMVRFFPIHFAEGSIHVLLTPLAFVVPWQTAFYDRPFFQRILGFHYNWYEYYAFVSPLPLVFCWQKKIRNQTIVRFLLFLLMVGALYVSLGYVYSPFYWIFRMIPAIQAFRVPQRIFFPMTTIVIVFFALAADSWFAQHTKRVWQWFGLMIMGGSLLWTSMVFAKTFTQSFENPRVLEESVSRHLRSSDRSPFAVADFVCCMQTFLIREKIGIVNYYYGWRPASSPNFIKSDGNGFDYSPLRLIRPKYIIAKAGESFEVYGYIPYITSKTIQVWKKL